MSAGAIRNNTTVGWTDNPDTRGTLDIILSCLFTIFACTWSVLHLNIPSPIDGTMTRLLRKIKWMIITILAPEYVFLQAIRERLNAYRSMEYLRQREDSGRLEGTFSGLGECGETHQALKWTIQQTQNWRQRFASIVIWLRRKEKSARPERLEMTKLVTTNGNGPEDQLSRKLWTIQHSYYANIGGIRLKISDPKHSRQIEFHCITAEHLAEVDFDSAYSPITQLEISEAEIQDKSKSDTLSKVIAVAQILWLVVSVIARARRRISTSQLEIVTLGFATMAVLLYAANWDKPQNTTEPTTVSLPRLSDDPTREETIRAKINEVSSKFKIGRLPDISCYPKDTWPGIGDPISKNHNKTKTDSQFLVILKNGGRISNEFNSVNPNTEILFYLVAALFGGLHLLAWNFDFPSRVELIMWRVASLVTTLGPSLVLFLYYQSQFTGSHLLLDLITGIVVFFYIPSRLALITIAFTSLRRMPADVYLTTWAKYLPNIQ